MLPDCPHEDSTITERGTLWCRDCRREMALDDATVLYDANTDEPYEYIVDGVAGSERCSDCLGNGTVYPSEATCHECSGTGRVAWRAYLLPPPLTDFRMPTR